MRMLKLGSDLEICSVCLTATDDKLEAPVIVEKNPLSFMDHQLKMFASKALPIAEESTQCIVYIYLYFMVDCNHWISIGKTRRLILRISDWISRLLEICRSFSRNL